MIGSMKTRKTRWVTAVAATTIAVATSLADVARAESWLAAPQVAGGLQQREMNIARIMVQGRVSTVSSNDAVYAPPSPPREFREHLDVIALEVEAERWEKALAAIDAAKRTDHVGLIAADDGLYQPLDQYISQLLRSLPPEGQRAFRMFNDKAAASMLVDADALRGEAQIEAYRQVANDFTLTPSGTKANDLLGDALFESGRFSEAVDAWRNILASIDHDAADVKQLRIKRAIAFAEAGDASSLRREVAVIRRQFANEQVAVAGEAKSVNALLDDLLVDQATDDTADPDRPREIERPSLQLPDPLAQSWRLQLFSDAARQTMVQPLTRYGRTTPPPPLAVADDHRVYVNHLGAVMAIDLSTGKPAWQSGDFEGSARRIADMIRYGHYPINDIQLDSTLEGGAVLVTSGNPFNQRQPHLRRLNTDNGQTLWDTSQNGNAVDGVALSSQDVLSSPTRFGDDLLIITRTQGQSPMSLFAISHATGEPAWRIPIGEAGSQVTGHGQRIPPIPAELTLIGHTAYVLTNMGGLIAVDLDRRELLWARAWSTSIAWSVTNYGSMTRAGKATRGALHPHAGRLMVKEAGDDILRWIDPASGRLLARLPFDRSATPIAFAGNQMILQNDAITSVNIDTFEPRWRTAHTMLGASNGGESDRTPVSFHGPDLFQLTSAGLFQISRTTGKLIAWIEDDPIMPDAGVATVVIGDNHLIAATAWSVYAMPLNPPTEPDVSSTP